MFYAGYESIDTDVAVFKTERQRDDWIKEWSVFDRMALSEGDVLFILDGSPDKAIRQRDDFNDSITWLINPVNRSL